MTYLLVTTPHFDRAFEKFVRAHRQLRPRLTDIFQNLEADPFHPMLRLQPLKGGMSGLHAVSITRSYRVVLTLLVEDDEIILLDIGSHDEVYR